MTRDVPGQQTHSRGHFRPVRPLAGATRRTVLRAAVLALPFFCGGSACADDEKPSQTQATSGPHTPLAADFVTAARYAKPAVEKGAPKVKLKKIVEGLQRPLFLTHAGDGSKRRFIVEQTGRIKVLNADDEIEEKLFADLSKSLISSGGEMGLLGLAFHPRFKENRQVFIAYSGKAADGARNFFQVVSRFTLKKGQTSVDVSTEERLLELAQPAGNHNGGMIAFGKDGYLYVGTGDGGAANDKFKQSRDPSVLLAKMLRIDVDKKDEVRKTPYAIPPDNPFIGDTRYAPEVWAIGLRNPWRYAFDDETGDLWIGDVGQNQYEEIHLVTDDRIRPKAVADGKTPRSGGMDFGWNVMEGTHCFAKGPKTPGRERGDCVDLGFEIPVFDYDHDQGCSVTGGFVARGQSPAPLIGRYLFSDYCTGVIWSLKKKADAKAGANDAYEVAELGKFKVRVSSFGVDEDGRVYVIGHKGAVYRVDVAKGAP